MSLAERVAMTVACRDCDLVPKVPNAGRIEGSVDGPVQVMHNGLRVVAGGYYGQWMSEIIRGLRGHHEPQEELLFHHLLAHVLPQSIFVELGSFWAYYANWFLRANPLASAICVEPDLNHLAVGRINLRLNHRNAVLINAAAGAAACEAMQVRRESDGRIVTIPCLDMDALLRTACAERIEVLHMDIQGAEHPFVVSMRNATAAGKLRFILVSTHHESISGVATTHEDCVAEIVAQGGAILAQHSVAESYSGDGLIVASFNPADAGIRMPAISRNNAQSSLFR